MNPSRNRNWLARALIAPVFAWNVQCALAFLIAPAAYAPGFDLAGEAGAATVRGMGVLFLMWNVPYALALAHPIRRRVSLLEALAMQAIGLVGEAWIYVGLSPAGVARAGVLRFILFDGAGLVLLALAAWAVFGSPRAALGSIE